MNTLRDEDWMPMWCWVVLFFIVPQLWLLLILLRFFGNVIQAAIIVISGAFVFWVAVVVFSKDVSWVPAPAQEISVNQANGDGR